MNKKIESLGRFKNTMIVTRHQDDITVHTVYLHGHPIFITADDMARVSTCGEPTATTIRRLNECFDAFDFPYFAYRHKRVPYISFGPHNKFNSSVIEIPEDYHLVLKRHYTKEDKECQQSIQNFLRDITSSSSS